MLLKSTIRRKDGLLMIGNQYSYNSRVRTKLKSLCSLQRLIHKLKMSMSSDISIKINRIFDIFVIIYKITLINNQFVLFIHFFFFTTVHPSSSRAFCSSVNISTFGYCFYFSSSYSSSSYSSDPSE